MSIIERFMSQHGVPFICNTLGRLFTSLKPSRQSTLRYMNLKTWSQSGIFKRDISN